MAFLFCVILTFSLPLAISANVIEILDGQECDNSQGEVWLSGSEVADFAACVQHCEDVADCQSITFYDGHQGSCSLFSTKCENTKPVGNARSQLVRELGGLFGVQCDTSEGEVWLSGSENTDFATCTQLCEHNAGCQSITFYHNGDCSLFSTKCEKTEAAPGAHSKVVKELEGKYGQQCDHSQGEIWLSESKKSDFVICKRSCEDDARCQSVTFYTQSGVCSHFATTCDKTVPSKGAISAFVKQNDGPAPEQCEIDGTCTIARGQECDRSQGEEYMNDGSADLSYAECKQACLDRLQCQSITYFSHGWCSLFKTQCAKRKHFNDAISVTLKADYFNAQECDNSKGEILLSGSSGKQATLAACHQSCEDDAECKSTTYFKSGWCSHYSTCCNERRASATATSDAVKTAKCVDACAIENGGCDTRRACTSTDGVATCGDCPAGLNNDGATGCINPDPCAINNGGCDGQRACANNNGVSHCGDCPAGFTNNGPRGCKAKPAPQPLKPTCGYASDVFLRIDGLTEASKIINIAEITAYDKDNKVIKPAYTALSSTHSPSTAYSVGKCVDGSKGNFCHTKLGDSNPYLLFRYDGAKLSKFTVTNRGNCCQDRIVGANFQICSDEKCAYKVHFSGKFEGQKAEYNFPLFPTGCKDVPHPTKTCVLSACRQGNGASPFKTGQGGRDNDCCGGDGGGCDAGYTHSFVNDNGWKRIPGGRPAGFAPKCNTPSGSGGNTCCTLGGGECAAGLVRSKDGRDCKVADPCDNNNGGCDAKRQCSSTGGKVTCGNCAAGFHKDGATGCKAGPKCVLSACRQFDGASPSKPGVGGRDNDCCAGATGGCDAGYTHSFVTDAGFAKIAGGRPAGFAPKCDGGNTCCTPGGGECAAGLVRDGKDCKLPGPICVLSACRQGNGASPSKPGVGGRDNDCCGGTTGGCDAGYTHSFVTDATFAKIKGGRPAGFAPKCDGGNTCCTAGGGECAAGYVRDGKDCQGIDGFIRIDGLAAGKVINLGEITAYGKDGKKIAPTQVTMSSTHSAGFNVNRCNDGNKNNFCHTSLNDKKPAIVFKYHGADIAKVVVGNRLECCQDRIAGANFRYCRDSGCTGQVVLAKKFDGAKKEYTFTF